MRSFLTPKAAATFASLAAALALSACSDTTSPTSVHPSLSPAFAVGTAANVGPVQVTFASSGTTQFCSSGTVIHGYTIPATYAPLTGCGTAFDVETNLTTSYNPGWGAPLPGSDWIGPNATSNEYRTAPGTYVFQTTFNIPAGATSPVLNDTLLSDNAVAVFLNGHPVATQLIQDCPTTQKAAGTCNWQTAFVISDNTPGDFIIGGTNTITVLLVDTPNGGTLANNYGCTEPFQPFGELGFGTPFNVPTSPNHIVANWTQTMTTTTGCENPTGLDFAGTVSYVPPIVFQGCSPGFYKNHTFANENETLLAAGFHTGSATLDQTTLKTALSFGGGPTLQDAKNMLAREVAAAFANIERLGSNYPLTLTELQTQANAAFASNDRSTILAFAATLDADNNLEGPSC